MAGLLAQIMTADAQKALRRLSGSTALIRVVPMPLPMAKGTSERVQNAEHYRDPDNGEPQSQQLSRQPQHRVHAPALRLTRRNVHGSLTRCTTDGRGDLLPEISTSEKHLTLDSNDYQQSGQRQGGSSPPFGHSTPISSGHPHVLARARSDHDAELTSTWAMVIAQHFVHGFATVS
jgi:hypothetical protein